ncbi:MAG: hypothetical protein L0G14_07565, partial [Lactococcus lactis]|nr:hypothetical protein [Lactococcus lactis]
ICRLRLTKKLKRLWMRQSHNFDMLVKGTILLSRGNRRRHAVTLPVSLIIFLHSLFKKEREL